MQQLAAKSGGRGRVVFFVPRWLPPAEKAGLPYRVFPVLSSLASHGWNVDFFDEVHDGVDSAALRGALPGAFAAVAWCAELNPATQIPGLVAFLQLVAAAAPEVPRIAGGGFFEILPPPRLSLAPLTETIVGDSAVGSLAQVLDSAGGGAPPATKREAYDAYAARSLDLGGFIKAEPMIFGNQLPALQIPTGYGCAKHCAFCFYENTKVYLLTAPECVDLVKHCRERYGVEQFLFGELDFLTSRPRALAIAAGLRERCPGVRWFALASVQDVLATSDAELATLAKSGLHCLEMGTEVGTDEGLRTLGKSFTTSDAVRATERLLAFGVIPLHNIILGWFGETAPDRRGTLRIVDRLKRLGCSVRFNFRVYQPTPSTTMGERALKQLPPLPSTLEAIASYRVEEGRSLPWLTREDEQLTRLLIEYLLPLGYDDALAMEAGPARRILRSVARQRCRTGFFRWPVDRWIFRRIERRGLAKTFIP
jgi:radical SAM superfamily enzyme YgiQ (UPF0313 family)